MNGTSWIFTQTILMQPLKCIPAKTGVVCTYALYIRYHETERTWVAVCISTNTRPGVEERLMRWLRSISKQRWKFVGLYNFQSFGGISADGRGLNFPMCMEEGRKTEKISRFQQYFQERREPIYKIHRKCQLGEKFVGKHKDLRFSGFANEVE